MRISYSSEGYCDPNDVSRFFDKVDVFSSSTSPTRSEVNQLIIERSEYIDRQTDHAFRANQVLEELKDMEGPYYFDAGIPVALSKRDIRPLKASEGDALGVWNGNDYENWVESDEYAQGRDEDYWIDRGGGILYIRDRYVFNRHPQLRITYRYGTEETPQDVKMATAKLVASDLIEREQFTRNVSGTGDPPVPGGEATKRYREDAQRVIQRRKETSYVEPF